MNDISELTTLASSLLNSIIAIVYLLAILNVFKILRDELSPSAASAWILLNLSFPFLGVPLYYFLGQNKIKGYSKRRQATRPPESSEREAQKLEDLVKGNIKAEETKRNNFDFAPPPSLNHIEILDSGDLAFKEIFAAISKAQSFILVQYYIFRPDSLGLHFKQLLIERAQAGVKIFFIFDNIGSVELSGRYIRQLKAHGIQVVRFLPFQFRFHLQVNFRNHRKLVVVDGQTAFLGGMNVGDEYLSRKKFWRDTQIKITGPAISSLMETFLDDWNFAVRPKRRNLPAPYIEQATPLLKEGGIPTQVISFGPGDQLAIGLYLFMHLIQSAKQSIIIATPYYIPDEVLERCLELAIIRGVEVTLLVPKKPDHWIMKPISFTAVRRLAKMGGQVYLYEKGFMHQKVMLIDRKQAMIGTSNFDNRSIYLNFETCVVITDETCANHVHQMLSQDIKDSSLLDPKKEESPWYLMFVNFARLLAPLF